MTRCGALARSRRHALAIALVGLLLRGHTSLEAAGLVAPEVLAKAYDLILDARFEEAHAQLQRSCPPAPAPSCQVLQAVADYWQILLDQENTSRDGRLLESINSSIAATESWVEREPKRAEAWFYNGGAYGTRVLLRGLREQYLAAARDGKRIHDSLRQAVTLDSSLGDGYFGLGLYHYYAAIAPTAARVVRFLLLLPAGDRAGGLKEMEQTRSRGLLLRGEADYQLHLIYLWYERQPLRALSLVDGLNKRYPHNPVFYRRLAIVQSEYLKNHHAALETYRALLEGARTGRVAGGSMSEVNARIGMAQEMDALCESANALAELRGVIAQRPATPYAALARAEYQAGLIYDRLGRRSEAIAAYQRAIASNPKDDQLNLESKARTLMKRPLTTRACK